MEIERKFLLDCLPVNIDKFEKDEIEQYYLRFEPEIRVRKIIKQKETEYIFAKKVGTGMVRDQKEYPIDSNLYNFLTQNEENIINKTRYKIPLSGKTNAEVDVYHDNLDGLKVVEVEFHTIEEANNFEVPNWFGEEVTNDPYYKNANLSQLRNATKKKN